MYEIEWELYPQGFCMTQKKKKNGKMSLMWIISWVYLFILFIGKLYIHGYGLNLWPYPQKNLEAD